MIFRLFHVYFSFLWKRFLALAKFFAQNFSFVCSFTPSTCYFPPGLNLRANIWMKPVPPVAVFVHTTHGCPADHVLRIKLCESTFLYYNVCSTKCQKNKGWVEKNLPKKCFLKFLYQKTRFGGRKGSLENIPLTDILLTKLQDFLYYFSLLIFIDFLFYIIHFSKLFINPKITLFF